jgi:predicted nucleic acid-binding protein
MIRLRSWLDGDAPLVGDASVWINLDATLEIDRIVRSTSRRFVITETALEELERGRSKGRTAAGTVTSLIKAGLIELVAIQPEHESTFVSLVAGSIFETLDDGEAATLAYATGTGAVAVIDERKASLIAKARFSDLLVVTTTEILFAPSVCAALSRDSLADAFFAALTSARMRVPEPWLEEVCDLLGHERIQFCPSIPARWRRASAEIASKF